jgi:hypothetical protein
VCVCLLLRDGRQRLLFRLHTLLMRRLDVWGGVSVRVVWEEGGGGEGGVKLCVCLCVCVCVCMCVCVCVCMCMCVCVCLYLYLNMRTCVCEYAHMSAKATLAIPWFDALIAS